MEKKYRHREVEGEIYKRWEEGGYFTPEIAQKKQGARFASDAALNRRSSRARGWKPPTRGKSGSGKPYCIIMPPPNANDNLHIGHARFITIEDILIRYHRMQGYSTLWLPGADHAGIETQFVYEKKLKQKGKTRFDFDRETLYKMIWDHVQQSKSNMENQLRVLGASCDWTRNKFTLDPEIVKIVYQTFKKMYDDGLVYRGLQLVNYCTQCGTGFSNLEVNYIERKHPLYYMRYGPFTLATVRPETKFGDTAIAVHPDDKRYKKWIGKEVEVQGLVGKFKIKVIADSAIDPEFGTGVAKVTPAHDHTDFEIGRRHNLAVKQVIDFDGKLNEKAGKYAGLSVKKARQVVAQDLEKAGLMVKVDKNYQHAVGVCYRCKTPIEPLPMEQWFIKVEPLVKHVKKAIDKGETKFAAKRYEKIFRHWLEILHDWNISRQIVWGIRIPAWKCDKCNEWIITDGKTPKQCTKCRGNKLTRDPDTFDTWFSSGQWPYATLQTTKPGDFAYFYPTSVMATGFDILALWVMRMMMFGLYETGKVPFKEVVIHGLVRDKHGKKISKSRGNVIDPVEMTEKYGADALRMALIWGAVIENDISLNEDNVRGQRNFANKIWNIGRFIEMHIGRLENKSVVMPFTAPRTDRRSGTGVASQINDAMNRITTKEDKAILKDLNKLVKSTTIHLDSYRFSAAAEELYDFTWNKLANDYLEKIKERLRDGDKTALQTLVYTYTTTLKLLHPFIPFVTEAVWQNLFPSEKPLIISQWP